MARILTPHSALERWQLERMPFLAGAEDRDKFFKRVSTFLPELDPRHRYLAHRITGEHRQ